MSKEDFTNISWVAKNNLCTGCGTCVPLCTTGAIELSIDIKRGIYVPNINKEKCTKCGICLKICPGREVDLIKLMIQKAQLFQLIVHNI